VTSEARRTVLRRRFLSLGLGELAAAAVLAYLVLGVVRPQASDDRGALVAALAPLVVVLVQAGVYWLLARTWVHRRPMPRALADLYRALRVLDAVLLLAAGTYVVLRLPAGTGTALLAVGLWAFAVVEYANYFVVRLSYPVREWARRVRERRPPRLVQDLRAAAT
jgi:hypothetical protein